MSEQGPNISSPGWRKSSPSSPTPNRANGWRFFFDFAENLSAFAGPAQGGARRGPAPAFSNVRRRCFCGSRNLGCRVQIYGDVAPESPTVKGFVGILAPCLSGADAG